LRTGTAHLSSHPAASLGSRRRMRALTTSLGQTSDRTPGPRLGVTKS
jgi:hypothetical protein